MFNRNNTNNNNNKNTTKDTQISHYCSITCLPIIRKLLTRTTGEKLYLLANEQKQCRTKS